MPCRVPGLCRSVVVRPDVLPGFLYVFWDGRGRNQGCGQSRLFSPSCHDFTLTEIMHLQLSGGARQERTAHGLFPYGPDGQAPGGGLLPVTQAGAREAFAPIPCAGRRACGVPQFSLLERGVMTPPVLRDGAGLVLPRGW